MTENAKPKGLLMTGAIGSIFFAVAWAIIITSIGAVMGMVMGATEAAMAGDATGAVSEGGARAIGGLMLLAAVLILAAGFLQGIGFLGLKKVASGLFAGAGYLTILVSIGLLLSVLGGIMGSMGMAQAGSYVLLFAMMLAAIMAGLGFFAGKDKGMMWMLGGITFLVGGLAALLIFVLGMLLKVNIGSFAQILAYAMVFGMLLGHVFSAIVMLGARK